MATTDVQVLAKGTQAAPLNYRLADNVELLLKMVSATFTDNTASGNWLPCVTLISDSGDVLGRAVDQGVKVTAGSDAEVSWFPGVKPAAAAAPGGSGIQFDTYPQAGGWLYVETTNAAGSPGWGTEVYDSSAGGDGIEIHSDNGNLNLLSGDHANLGGNNTHITGVFTIVLDCGDIQLNTSAQVKMEQNASPIGGQQCTIPNGGGVFRVKDHLGNLVFEARGDGTLHGQTGGSLVFDL